MATKKALDDESAYTGELLDDESFNGESLNPALETLYAELGISGEGEAVVFVSQLDADKKGAEAQVWRGSPDDYDLEAIARTFGSGNYRVKVYVRGPTGHRAQR